VVFGQGKNITLGLNMRSLDSSTFIYKNMMINIVESKDFGEVKEN